MLFAGYARQRQGSGAVNKLIATNAVKEALVRLVPAFERASRHEVEVVWGGTLDISRPPC